MSETERDVARQPGAGATQEVTAAAEPVTGAVSFGEPTASRPETYRRWVSIYWDFDKEAGGLLPYLRLTPDFMDLEAAGFSHGLGLSGFGKNQDEVERFADRVEAFMDALIADFKSEAAEPSV